MSPDNRFQCRDDTVLKGATTSMIICVTRTSFLTAASVIVTALVLAVMMPLRSEGQKTADLPVERKVSKTGATKSAGSASKSLGQMEYFQWLATIEKSDSGWIVHKTDGKFLLNFDYLEELEQFHEEGETAYLIGVGRVDGNDLSAPLLKMKSGETYRVRGIRAKAAGMNGEEHLPAVRPIEILPERKIPYLSVVDPRTDAPLQEVTGILSVVPGSPRDGHLRTPAGKTYRVVLYEDTRSPNGDWPFMETRYRKAEEMYSGTCTIVGKISQNEIHAMEFYQPTKNWKQDTLSAAILFPSSPGLPGIVSLVGTISRVASDTPTTKALKPVLWTFRSGGVQYRLNLDSWKGDTRLVHGQRYRVNGRVAGTTLQAESIESQQ
jgi:hypothetical protein